MTLNLPTITTNEFHPTLDCPGTTCRVRAAEKSMVCFGEELTVFVCNTHSHMTQKCSSGRDDENSVKRDKFHRYLAMGILSASYFAIHEFFSASMAIGHDLNGISFTVNRGYTLDHWD